MDPLDLVPTRVGADEMTLDVPQQAGDLSEDVLRGREVEQLCLVLTAVGRFPSSASGSKTGLRECMSDRLHVRHVRR
jgi:hypothetical protein